MVRKVTLVCLVSLCLLSLPAAAATKTWNGSLGNLWSVGGNWNGGIAPVDGDQLVFPDGASNRTMSNDLSGLDVASISFPGTASDYSASGNAITLAGGITTAAAPGRPITWSIPITLTATQDFGGSGVNFAGSIDLNGFSLRIFPSATTFSGSLTGSGAFTVGVGGAMNFTGTSTFTGTFSQFGGLHVTGSIANSTMTGGGILAGTGTVPALTFSGILRPGQDFQSACCNDPHTTGIFSTGSLTLNHVQDPTLFVDIHGATPGVNYDQVAVTGTVTLNNPTLQGDITGVPGPGQSFIIISNDGVDPVSGTFNGLPEGASITLSGKTLNITYVGGDGNDVALTAPSDPASKVWTGAVSNLWSVGGNWSGAVAPVDGDNLLFPDFTSNRAMSNDISGLDLASVKFTGTSDNYSASGNTITLTNGLVGKCCAGIVWSIPITLAATQDFNGAGVNFAGPIDLNGFSLRIFPSSGIATIFSGSLIGTGAFTVGVGGGMVFSGTSTFTGTFSEFGGLNVTGSISNSTMTGAGILGGTGTIPALTFSGILRPGPDAAGGCCSDSLATGILSTGSLILNHVQEPTMAVDIQGTTPGTGYDQVSVTGTVTLNNPTLKLTLLGVPSEGQTFTIISNDGVDAISGTFSGLAEGATLTASGVTFQISYVGGDGNDVVLTVPNNGSSTWTGAVNNLWSVGGNWADGIPPADGDQLVFPDFASNRTMVNDLIGLDLASVKFTGTVSSYSASGNAITLAGGMTSVCCGVGHTWSIPITLSAAQTFQVTNLTFGGPIDLNGFALKMIASNVTLSGSLIGSGSFTVALGGSHLNLTGTSTFTGTFSQFAPLNVAGSITNSTMNGSSLLSGTGTLPALTFNGVLRPGNDSCCSGGFDAHTTAILSTGPLSLSFANPPTLAVDLEGPLPGTNYDQVAVIGTVTLNNPTLQITLDGAAPSPGQTFIIIANDGLDAVSGTFASLPEGAQVNSVNSGPGIKPFRISYIGGTGNDVVLTALAASTTTLVSGPNPTVTGEPINLTATVTSPAGTPTGTVIFKDGATTLATVSLDGSGVAATTVALPAGTHSIRAEYQGEGVFAASASAPNVHTVNKGDTTTTLTNPPVITHGDALPVEVDVAAVDPATGTPTGTVTVSANGQQLVGPLTAGELDGDLTGLAPGIHTISASYGGDANFNSSATTGQVEVLAIISSPDMSTNGGSSNSTVNVVVNLSGASNQTVTVDYATTNGTATAGSDYLATSGTLQFDPGETSQTIAITILGDVTNEPAETFRVLFSNPQHATLESADMEVTITDVQAAASDVPTLDTIGLILLGLAVAGAGMFVMRR